MHGWPRHCCPPSTATSLCVGAPPGYCRQSLEHKVAPSHVVGGGRGGGLGGRRPPPRPPAGLVLPRGSCVPFPHLGWLERHHGRPAPLAGRQRHPAGPSSRRVRPHPLLVGSTPTGPQDAEPGRFLPLRGPCRPQASGGAQVHSCRERSDLNLAISASRALKMCEFGGVSALPGRVYFTCYCV